ncbi:TPA: restriction endonuclease subunit S [Haemophilus influenzae]
MKNNRTFLEKLLDGAEVEWKTLDEISSIYGGLTGKGKADFENGNALYVPYKNIFNNIEVDFNNLDTVNVPDDEKQYAIKYGDVLFTGSSETAEEAGMSSAVTTKTEKKIYLNSFSFGLRFNDDVELLPEFSKFLFRTLSIRKEIVKSASGVTRFNISKARFKKIKIPIPPLSVQTEIVKILDALTALTSELTCELILRQKQYEYYREKLLSEEELGKVGFEWRALKDILIRTKGTKITAAEMKVLHKENAPLKIFAGGKTFALVNYSDIPEKDINKNPSIIVKSRGIIEFEYYDKPFSHKNEMWSYYSNDKNINIKYIYYVLKNQEPYFQSLGSKMQMPQIAIPDTDKYLVPIPPPYIQTEIVKVLDKFVNLTNSISEGLPLAIEQSQKRYEYYKELLLSFS